MSFPRFIVLVFCWVCWCFCCAAGAAEAEGVRERILTEGQRRVWALRDPAEFLTLGEVTDVRGAWARIELLLHRGRPDEKLVKQAEGVLGQTVRALVARQEERVRALVRDGATAGESWFNDSRGDALGWGATGALPFDNDVGFWEFDLLPATVEGTTSIGLAGLWRFKLDPEDEGAKRGYARPEFDDRDWGLTYAPAQAAWVEAGAKGGLGWYRKRVIVPADWAGEDLVLKLGARGGNRDWVSINGHFLNVPGDTGSQAEFAHIDARLVRAGMANTIAIRTQCEGGAAGLIAPDLRLSTARGEPGVRRLACSAGVAREVDFRSGEAGAYAVYSSALSPGAVVATGTREIRLGGWVARGYRVPRRLSFVSQGKLTSINIEDEAALDARRMDENWVMLWDNRNGVETPRPVMIVFERRPVGVRFLPDGFGGRAVRVGFGDEGARVAVVRPFAAVFTPELTEEHLERCRVWSRALLRYPIGYLYTGEGARGVRRWTYEYLALRDDWKTTPLVLAPAPPELARAAEGGAARVAAALVDLGCRPAERGFFVVAEPSNYFATFDRSWIGYGDN